MLERNCVGRGDAVPLGRHILGICHPKKVERIILGLNLNEQKRRWAQIWTRHITQSKREPPW